MCRFCKNTPVYEFTNKRKLCKTCFIRWFDKKFLYTLRKFHMVKKNESVSCEDKGDFRGVVLQELLEMFAEKGNVKLIKNKKGAGKTALSDTSDFISDEIIYGLIKGKINTKEYLPIHGKIIRPLYLFLDKEVLLYARLKKMNFKKLKEKKDEISFFTDKLEEKHPELKHAIVRSYLELTM